MLKLTPEEFASRYTVIRELPAGYFGVTFVAKVITDALDEDVWSNAGNHEEKFSEIVCTCVVAQDCIDNGRDSEWRLPELRNGLVVEVAARHVE